MLNLYNHRVDCHQADVLPLIFFLEQRPPPHVLLHSVGRSHLHCQVGVDLIDGFSLEHAFPAPRGEVENFVLVRLPFDFDLIFSKYLDLPTQHEVVLRYLANPVVLAARV